MHLISKEVYVPGRDGRSVFPGFVGYLSAAQPRLIHRYGWLDESDTYDDFADSFSEDNGATWSEPAMRLQSRETSEGCVRYAENACFLDPDTGQLLTLCSRALYPPSGLHWDTTFEVTWDMLDPATGQWLGERVVSHDLPGGLGISFCVPIKTRSGRLLVPGYSLLVDEAGQIRHYPGLPSPLETALVIRGEYQADGSIEWECGGTVSVDPEQSSRGYSENALMELADGRIAMLTRGDNSAYPERPGHKWLCWSTDEGLTWSPPEPFGCSDGEPLESSSTGCALFHSLTDGQVYFIGNLAMDGERANGNWPRSPLVIAQVQEEPFALRRETITVIDRRQEGEPPLTQMSNFRYYQDRQTGDVVLFLSRYGEKDPDNFKIADYYCYRVAMK